MIHRAFMFLTVTFIAFFVYSTAEFAEFQASLVDRFPGLKSFPYGLPGLWVVVYAFFLLVFYPHKEKEGGLTVEDFDDKFNSLSGDLDEVLVDLKDELETRVTEVRDLVKRLSNTSHVADVVEALGHSNVNGLTAEKIDALGRIMARFNAIQHVNNDTSRELRPWEQMAESARAIDEIGRKLRGLDVPELGEKSRELSELADALRQLDDLPVLDEDVVGGLTQAVELVESLSKLETGSATKAETLLDGIADVIGKAQEITNDYDLDDLQTGLESIQSVASSIRKIAATA